jgi:uncharacterized protein (TIGR03084 family)
LTQALDFRDECNALHALLRNVDDAGWNQPTQFKGWTFNDVLGHLYLFDHAATLTLQEPAAFAGFMRDIRGSAARGQTMLEYTRAWHGDSGGPALLSRWRECCEEVARLYSTADPARRVAWAGPEMSVRSCISARQMETWAHGQALFDALGQTREEKDRIKNIAIMGINTFAWTFANRGADVPPIKPFVQLSSPSGAIWEWNEPNTELLVEGTAVDFCRVVTQTRNVRDTNLRLHGETALRWMADAQCFAGPPQRPPAPGTRFAAALQRG